MSVLLGGHQCAHLRTCFNLPHHERERPLAAMLDLVFAQCAEAH